MTTLLLTSAGTNVKEEIIKILPKPAHLMKLAYIITASKPELNKSYVVKDKKELQKMGFTIEDIDIEGKNEDELRRILKEKDIICVQGGNTFYLLKHAKLSGFDRVIKELVNRGTIYIGISAGSYIVCPTIEQATWKSQDRSHFDLTDLTALNLVPFLISAHFTEDNRAILEKAASCTKYPVVALNDTQAVLVIDGKWKVVGKGKLIKLCLQKSESKD